MSVVDRKAYMGMVDNGSIDNVIYPQHTTIGKILTHVREDDISCVHSLLRGKAEAFEATVQDNGTKSHIAGKNIGDIKLPKDVIIIGLVRQGESIPARSGVTLKGGDHLILFIADKSAITQVEALFKPTKSLLSKILG